MLHSDLFRLGKCTHAIKAVNKVLVFKVPTSCLHDLFLLLLIVYYAFDLHCIFVYYLIVTFSCK